VKHRFFDGLYYKEHKLQQKGNCGGHLRSTLQETGRGICLLCNRTGLLQDNKKKMDAVQVESILAEAGLTKNNSQILFRDLNQFFGKGRFESEHKHHAFFAGNEYSPVVDNTTLPDKTVIDFWYKEPDKMLQHQINNIIKKEQLSQLTHVDLSVGGDHGGRKFWMALKVLF
jgi:hypothetical protein